MIDETENGLNNIQENETLLDEIAVNQSEKKNSSLLLDSSSSKKRRSTKKKIIKKFHHEQITSPKVIPRHCLEKKDWINLLATPSLKYSPSLNKNLKINTIYYYNLSPSTRYKIIAKLHDRTSVVPVPFVNELIHILADDHFSLDEVEQLFQNISIKKNNQKVKKAKCQNVIKPVQYNESLKMSKDTVLCQYNIAEAFVKSILQYKDVALKEDLADLVQVIQKKLMKTIENNDNLDKDGKVYQQTLFLSQLIANWIAGVLEEVAEQNEEELKKECEERRQRMETDLFDESNNISDDDHEDVFINTEKVVNSQDKNEDNDKREEFGSNGTNDEQSADELINQNETKINAPDYHNNITDNETNNKNNEDYERNYEQETEDND